MSNYFIFKEVKIKIVKYFIFTFLFSLSFSIVTTNNFDKCLWIQSESMKDSASISKALYFAYEYHFDKVFIQCRSRGDAFYNSTIVPQNNSIVILHRSSELYGISIINILQPSNNLS